MSKEKKPRKLTKKERGFVQDYVLTENGTQSALKNYDTENHKTASVIASENLGKPRIQAAILETQKTLKQALIENGVTPEYIAKKVNVLLTATDKDGNQDFTAVDKGLKHATNIYGVEDPADKPKSSNTTYNFIFSPEVQENIKHMEVKIKEQLLQKKNKSHDNQN